MTPLRHLTPRDAASVCVACATAHALSWLALPAGMRGTWLNASQLLLVVGLALLVWACACARQPLQAADRTAVAACLGVVVADNTVTALIAAAWLVNPWEVNEGEDLLTEKYGPPVALLAASAYAAVAAHLSKKPGSKQA